MMNRNGSRPGFAMRVILAALLTAATLPAAPLPGGATLRLGTDAFRTPAPAYSSAFSPDGKLLAIGTTQGLSHPFVVVFDAATGKPLHRFKAFGHVVRDLSFSPDGLWLTAANGDNSLTLYDLSRDDIKWRIMNTGSDCAQFLPDGETVASENKDGVVLVNRQRISDVRQLSGPTKRVHVLRASDKGDLLAAASEDGAVTVWDVKTGDTRHTFAMPAKYALGLAFSPDGARLAAAGFDGDYVVWDLKTAKTLWAVRPENPEAGGPLTFSADGKDLIGLRRGGRVFDAETGKVKSTPKNLPPHHHGGISADRKRFSPVFSDHVARVADVSTGELVHPVEGHRFPPTAVVFAEGGKAIYTGTKEDLCRWDAATGKLTKRVDARAEALVASPDGERLASAGQTIDPVVWKLPSLKQTTIMESHLRYASTFVGSLHAAADGFSLVFNGEIKPYSWDLAETKLKPYRSEFDNLAESFGAKSRFAPTPDGRAGIIASNTKAGPQLVWWDFVAGKVIRSQPNGQGPKVSALDIRSSANVRPADYTNSPAAPLAFLPDDRGFIAESEEGFLLLRADTAERVRLLCSQGHLATSQSIVGGGYVHPSIPFAVSPDGRLLAVGQDMGIHLVEVATGEIRRTFQPGERVRALAFSPDGQRIASTGESCSALVWDVYAPVIAAAPDRSLTGTAANAQPIMSSLRQHPAELIALAKALTPAKKGDAARVAEWLKDLDAPKYAAREAAQFALAKLDADTLPVIDAHLKTPGLSPEARTRAEKARAALRTAPPTPDRRRDTRTLELLERLNTPEARREMARLATGEPGSALTLEAAESLKRMDQRAK